MEEQLKGHQTETEMSIDELIRIIRTTFSAPSQKEQKDAEDTAMTQLKKAGFFQKMYLYLTDSKNSSKPSDIDKAVAVLIKKFAYDFSKQEEEKSQFIQMLFNLILSDRIDFAAKDILGTALEYQFNEDQSTSSAILRNLYKKTVIDRTLSLMENSQNLKSLEGLMIICLAYLNSLVDIQDQIEFFVISIGNIHIAALCLLQEISKIPFEEWMYRDKQILPKINKIFEYIQTSMERVIDEQQYFHNQLDSIRSNQFLISILQNYLPLFHNNGSLLSQVYPQINQTKRIVVNIITLLYSNYKCPIKIFNTVYITFLVECQYRDRDSTAEAILINCLELMSMHLEKKYYYKVYVDNLVQTILALFMYSTTSRQEYEALNNNPEEFSDIAEYYASGDDKYYNLKVKSSVLLRLVAQKIDEAMKHLTEIIITIMTSTLDIVPGDSEIMSEVKAQTSTFDIYGLSNEQKLETSLMVLCTLSPYIYRRQDISHLIYAFFISQFQILTKTTSTIVILRLMRIISVYSISLYFSYVEGQIKKGKVFAIQGLKCFEKIVKSNRYAEIFSYLSKIMGNLISSISITDSLMQLIVFNNYETMIQKSPQLFEKILKKIKDEFFVNKDKNEHATLICFNLIYALIKKVTEPNDLFLLKQLFFEILSHLQKPEEHHCLQKYDEKIVQIMEILMPKDSFVSEEIDNFVNHSLNYLSVLEKGTQYFRFYNQYISRLSGATYKLQPLFLAFWNEVKVRFERYIEKGQYNDGISYFCFLMSEIMGNHCKIDIPEGDLKSLLMMTQKLPHDKKQYPLTVFLTHLYLFPYPVCVFLKQNQMYEGFLSEVVKISFEGTIIKRIFVLSLIKLLEIEDNPHNFSNILIYCIDHLKNQCRKTKRHVEKPIQPRTRNFFQQERLAKLKEREGEVNDDNELVHLFVKLWHPFNSLSEFGHFKVIFWQNDHQVNSLSPELRSSLRTILETEWVENKPRRILQIKK